MKQAATDQEVDGHPLASGEARRQGERSTELMDVRDLVEPLSLAAAAAGADGIIVEVHPAPDEAICDGPQALHCDDVARFAAKVEQVAPIAGKRIAAVL